MTTTETRKYLERFTIEELVTDGRPGKLSAMQGRAVPYGKFAPVGWFLEQHAAASFKRSTDTAARGLPLHLFHDSRDFPIGVSTSWEHADDALYGTWRLNESAEAQRAAAAAADGELNGLSVGFIASRSSWEFAEDWDPDLGPEHMDKVTRLESRLVEVSMTSTPAFPEAEVLLVRTALRPHERPGREVEGWRRRIDALKAARS